MGPPGRLCSQIHDIGIERKQQEQMKKEGAVPEDNVTLRS